MSRSVKLILMMLFIFSAAASLSAVEAVCHRGANYLAPENTLAAGMKAVEMGAEWVEIDVRKSSDGVLYLMHDSTVNRTTNGSGKFSKLTSEEIDRLDAGSWFSEEFAGEKVPRLSDYLDWAKGKIGIYFDIKTSDYLSVLEMIYEKGVENESFVWSSSLSMMLKIRKAYPDIAIKGNSIYSKSYLKRLKPQYYEIKFAALKQSDIDLCRKNGWKILIHELGRTSDQLEQFEKIIEAGVWGVNLDDLEAFMQARKKIEQTAE